MKNSINKYLFVIVIVSMIAMLLLVAGCQQQTYVCEDGKTVSSPDQCTVKAKESCNDGLKNQDETDVDCGGVCSPCQLGQACETKTDCASGLCENAQCSKVVEPEPEPTPEPVANDYTIDQNNVDKLNEILVSKPKIAKWPVATPTQLDSGDSFVFAVGVTQQPQEEREYFISFEFKSAKDTRNNNIEVDPALIVAWFSETPKDSFKLNYLQNHIIPAVVVVGDEIAKGKPVVSGTYNVDIVISYYADTRKDLLDEYARDTLAVRIMAK